MPTSSITVDDYWGAFEATEHLIRRGGKRIAHLKGPNGLTVCEKRFQGYRDCLEKHNLDFDERLIINTNFKADSAILPMRSLMALENPPDSVFGVNDVVASAAMQVIRDMGFSIPNQVAVIGFDNSPFSAYLNPGLSTVNRFGKLVGEKATELFLNSLTEKSTQQETIVLRPELIVRNSTMI